MGSESLDTATRRYDDMLCDVVGDKEADAIFCVMFDVMNKMGVLEQTLAAETAIRWGVVGQ